jgi:hypothetical protein
LRSQFEDLEASRQACVDEEVAGDEAELQGFTAVLGRTPNAGDENPPGGEVSVWRENRAEEEGNGGQVSFGSFYRRWMRASSRFGARGGRQHEGEVEHGVAVASSARRG